MSLFCPDCFEPPDLVREIRKLASNSARCALCGSVQRCISFESLAELIQFLPGYYMEVSCDTRGPLRQSSSSEGKLLDLVQGEFELFSPGGLSNTSAAAALVVDLANLDHEAEFRYNADSIYTGEDWLDECERFSFDDLLEEESQSPDADSSDRLDRIEAVAWLLHGRCDNWMTVRDVGDGLMWRCVDDTERDGSPLRDVGPPPEGKRRRNRCNDEGQIALYCSLDLETAVRENGNAGKGGRLATVGVFEVSDRLVLLDLRQAKRFPIRDPFGPFEDREVDRIMRRFEICLESPTAATNGYILSRLLSNAVRDLDLRWRDERCGFDGILYRSVCNAGGVNCALFEHAIAKVRQREETQLIALPE